MRVVVQRVTQASVSIEKIKRATIGKGLVLFVGISHEDNQADLTYLATKIAKLRIFEDAEGKMNVAIRDIAGEVLSISQFTLYAETRKGNRPNFMQAARPPQAQMLYTQFNEELIQLGIPVQTGVFGGDMQIKLENDGPVTIILDSKNK